MPEQAEPYHWESATANNIEGIVPCNVIRVSKETASRLVSKLTVPTNIGIELPDNVTVKSANELKALKANAIYSDGTTALKTVDWNDSEVDWNQAGTYRITGKVHQDRYVFPIAVNRADPCITKWNGNYYFIATNDADGNQTLFIREAAAIPELVDAEESLILDTKTYEHIKGLLWAPEIHIIEGDLYIFHAATTGDFLCV